jgi:hypothetical protein
VDASRVVIALLCAGGIAAAHKSIPKQVAVTLRRDAVEVVVEYVVEGDVARTLRRLLPPERVGAHLAREALAFLVVSVDGAPLALEQTGLHLEILPQGYYARVTVGAALPLRDGRHALRVVDRHKDRRVSVPVRLEAGRWVTVRERGLPFVDEKRAFEASFDVNVPRADDLPRCN